MSPFAKVQSISAVYFPTFSELIGELDGASNRYLIWIYNAEHKRITHDVTQLSDGFKEAFGPYSLKRKILLDALKRFAAEEFQ